MELPTIDLKPFLTENDQAACFAMAEAFVQYGACLVKDPRVTAEDNSKFLNIATEYFDLPVEEKMKDVRKNFGYQVGATPGLVEAPKCSWDPNCDEVKRNLVDQPTAWTGNDPKWRFFWRVGSCVSEKYPILTEEKVIPQSLSENWEFEMDSWGNKLVDTGMTISKMAAIGLGYGENAFLDYTRGGPHLLAPTGSDLSNAEKGDVFAAFHYDMNFITIHGQSRFPGLYIWPRNTGRKLEVKIPRGMLLVQAGKQFEYVTSGRVLAGYHEVVVNENTLNAIHLAKPNNRSLWRASSTLFIHAHPDTVLMPLDVVNKVEDDEVVESSFGYKTNAVVHEYPNLVSKYPPIATGDFIKNELAGIDLLGK
eukprot:NODE_201_length_15044_cov_0.334560.p1 type:complete len:365 gc:universal NODE_201_length_15044_cov_0.334560:11770-10676(-)